MGRMPGLSIKELRKHYALIPLFVCLGAGVTWAGVYLSRLALRSPDVSWHKGNPLPNEEYRNKQYKFYSPNIDYSKLESQAPKY